PPPSRRGTSASRRPWRGAALSVMRHTRWRPWSRARLPSWLLPPWWASHGCSCYGEGPDHGSLRCEPQHPWRRPWATAPDRRRPPCPPPGARRETVCRVAAPLALGRGPPPGGGDERRPVWRRPPSRRSVERPLVAPSGPRGAGLSALPHHLWQ